MAILLAFQYENIVSMPFKSNGTPLLVIKYTLKSLMFEVTSEYNNLLGDILKG